MFLSFLYSLQGKVAASVLSKLFIIVIKWCHIAYVPWRMSGYLISNVNNKDCILAEQKIYLRTVVVRGDIWRPPHSTKHQLW